ncbi:hypothetical protein DPMN_061552 [Dreissena polymorpha]|uniref:MIB/HERC2 domain-containing protein n=1 Tax=Dreissena polymorpha TaxID=45954 RepID=A0A9D4HJA2_DREPO|nr:hypothetical protein DPMN_061552 [Dreissena polymorpha]
MRLLYFIPQDGGGPGTVLSVYSNSWARVKWDKDAFQNYYRVGAEGKYDLLILADGQ